MSVAPVPAPAQNVTKPRKAAAKPSERYPKFWVMIAAAVESMNERDSATRQAILKCVMDTVNLGNYCDEVKTNARVKTALKSGLTAGTLNQAKGTGAAGSFRLGGKKKAAKTKPKKVVKPKAAGTNKPESPKKAAVKKLTYPREKAAAAKPKKEKIPKKAAVAKSKSPAKEVAEPKTPKKAAEPKTPE